MMQNNPIGAMMGLMQSGGNPKALLRQMAASNPQISQVMQMVEGKSENQLRDMTLGIARNQGVDVEKLARSIGIPVYRKK